MPPGEDPSNEHETALLPMHLRESVSDTKRQLTFERVIANTILGSVGLVLAAVVWFGLGLLVEIYLNLPTVIDYLVPAFVVIPASMISVRKLGARAIGVGVLAVVVLYCVLYLWALFETTL